MSESLHVVPESKELSECLLDKYRPEDCVYFSSSQRALLAQPPFAALLVSGLRDLPQQVDESLRLAVELGFTNSIVVGAIPFNISEKSYLRVCTNCQISPKPTAGSIATESVGVDRYAITAFPSPLHFKAGVKKALYKFAKGELKKVVLSRMLKIHCNKPPNVRALVKNLDSRNSKGYTFAVHLNDTLEKINNKKIHALIGASPELLISRRGNKVVAQPLAGSEPRAHNSELDKQRTTQLLTSKKDLREHAVVVKAIAEVLSPLCSSLSVPKKPSIVSTESMWHLGTTIEGTLRNENLSSLALALAIHPTPAVCGYPQHKAQMAIRELEQHDRGLFTGMVGWCDANGDGEWAVTLRCAEVEETHVRLYAGAGLVAGSVPEKELAETGAKFNTMLNALGMNSV